jgi:hypothetical protein
VVDTALSKITFASDDAMDVTGYPSSVAPKRRVCTPVPNVRFSTLAHERNRLGQKAERVR